MHTFIPRQESDHSCHDSCPSALRLFPAQDGGIARIRKPGSLFTPAELHFLGEAAAHYGDGFLHLSNRSHPQLRGVRKGDMHQGLIADIAAAGLLPHPTHDSVRTILVSPLHHSEGPSADSLARLVDELDQALCACPAVADLSGRTIIALDNGSGDVCYERPDLGAVAQPNGSWMILLAAAPTPLTCAQNHLVEILAAAAQYHAEFPRQQWRMVDEEQCRETILMQLREHYSRQLTELKDADVSLPPRFQPTAGITADTVVATIPFGRMTAEAAQELAGFGYSVRFTPWHSVAIYGVSAAARDDLCTALTRLGMSVDPRHPANWISACGGQPGCRRAHADVRGDAWQQMHSSDYQPGVRIHYVGCARRCGHPNAQHWERLATAQGEYVETLMDADGRTPVTSGGHQLHEL